MEMKELKPMRLRISPSSLGAYKQCQVQFKLAYIDKLSPLISGTTYSILGVSVHEAIDTFYKTFKDKGISDLPSILISFETIFQTRCHKQLPDLPPITYLSFLESGKKMIETYFNYDVVNGNINFVLDSEKKFVIDCGDFDLVGIVDRSYKKDGLISITDYKTGAPRSQKDVDKDDQLSFYSWMYRKSTGVIPNTLCLHFLKTDKRVYTQRNEEDLDKFYESIIRFKDRVMTQTEFEPNFKNCGMCDFKFNCPIFQKRKIKLT
jgi:hypothetical protein